MLAAATDSSYKLDVVKRTLLMVLNGGKEVPAPVKSYFNDIIIQARQLLDDPNSLSKDIFPESIDLAIEMRNYEGFSAQIAEINSVNDISAALADKLLKSMKEHSSVHQD